MKAFVSGHVNITPEEFALHYVPKLSIALAKGDDFVVGCANGADRMALEWLHKAGIFGERVTVYGYEKSLTTMAERMDYFSSLGFKTVVGFSSYTSRDAQMTADSDYDIAWVRPPEECKKLLGENYNPNRKSGTELNLIRRSQSKDKR